MTQPIKPGQLYALNRLIDQFANSRAERLYVIGQLVDHATTSTKDLTLDEWRRIRDEAYPHWHEDDWEPCRKCRPPDGMWKRQRRIK